VADGSVYEPADLPCAELPCRTIPSGLDSTLLHQPTRASSVDWGLLKGQKKKRLAFGVNRDPSPALFKALYGLERNAQELGHLQLGFSQVVSNFREFLFVHMSASGPTVPQCGSNNPLLSEFQPTSPSFFVSEAPGNRTQQQNQSRRNGQQSKVMGDIHFLRSLTVTEE